VPSIEAGKTLPPSSSRSGKHVTSYPSKVTTDGAPPGPAGPEIGRSRTGLVLLSCCHAGSSPADTTMTRQGQRCLQWVAANHGILSSWRSPLRKKRRGGDTQGRWGTDEESDQRLCDRAEWLAEIAGQLAPDWGLQT